MSECSFSRKYNTTRDCLPGEHLYITQIFDLKDILNIIVQRWLLFITDEPHGLLWSRNENKSALYSRSHRMIHRFTLPFIVLNWNVLCCTGYTNSCFTVVQKNILFYTAVQCNYVLLKKSHETHGCGKLTRNKKLRARYSLFSWNFTWTHVHWATMGLIPLRTWWQTATQPRRASDREFCIAMVLNCSGSS